MRVRWGIIMDVDSANEKQRHKVKSSLIGWTHTRNGPYLLSTMRSVSVGHDNKKELNTHAGPTWQRIYVTAISCLF